MTLTHFYMDILKKLTKTKQLKLTLSRASHKLAAFVWAKDQSSYEENYEDE